MRRCGNGWGLPLAEEQVGEVSERLRVARAYDRGVRPDREGCKRRQRLGEVAQEERGRAVFPKGRPERRDRLQAAAEQRGPAHHDELGGLPRDL